MAQCDYNKEVIDKILTMVGDIAERVGKMDGKVDAIQAKVDKIESDQYNLVIPKIDETDDKVETIQTTTETKHVLKQVCTTCNGTGKQIYYEDNQPGVPQERQCPLCKGAKEVVLGRITS